MMKRIMQITAGVVLLSMAGIAAAQKPSVYPAQGQSQAQQSKDDGECYVWAKQDSGIDPAAVAATPAPAQQTGPAVGGGERARGALRGAAVGGIIDGGDGAGKGAALGVVAGGVRARNNQKSQNAQAQQQSQAQKQGSMNSFYRAYGACMSGRGYSVK